MTKIGEVSFLQAQENGCVRLSIKVPICKDEDIKYKVSAQLYPSFFNGAKLPKVEVMAKTCLLMEGDSEINMEYVIDKPRIWMPEGEGDQHLYNVDFTIKPAGMRMSGGAAALEITKVAPLDEKSYTIRLTTMQVDTIVDMN